MFHKTGKSPIISTVDIKEVKAASTSNAPPVSEDKDASENKKEEKK